ncbi:MAG: hypothetical protein EBU36_02935 [Verrucomicrobia bacterium]|nr:hypothetical protein [Verrucomicrobiota bacterium]
MSPTARPSPESAPRYLLVDGHSVLHAWPELRKLHSSKPASARETLIRQLSRLHDSGKWRVTLVFDGQKGGKEERLRASGKKHDDRRKIKSRWLGGSLNSHRGSRLYGHGHKNPLHPTASLRRIHPSGRKISRFRTAVHVELPRKRGGTCRHSQ